MRKYWALPAVVLLVLCSLTACGEKMPTPDQLIDSFAAADKVRLEMYVNYDDIQSSTTVIEQDGDRTKVRMETTAFGATDGDEYYTATEDGKQYLYAPNKDGVWEKELLGEWFIPASVGGFAELFDSDLYYETEEGYRMYKTSSAKLDGMTFNDAEITKDEDGNYVLTAVVSRTIEEMPVFGSVKITVTMDEKFSVTLPVPGEKTK